MKETVHHTDPSIMRYLNKCTGRKGWFFFLQINRISDIELSQGLNKSAENAVL